LRHVLSELLDGHLIRRSFNEDGSFKDGG